MRLADRAGGTWASPNPESGRRRYFLIQTQKRAAPTSATPSYFAPGGQRGPISGVQAPGGHSSSPLRSSLTANRPEQKQDRLTIVRSTHSLDNWLAPGNAVQRL